LTGNPVSEGHTSTGNSTPLRAAPYYRSSTLKQEDSADRQRSQVVPYAGRKRYQIVRENVPDGHKAEVVRFLFERYDRGETLYAVAEELHRRGVASPRGGTRWTRSVVQRVLTNRRYVGDYTWGVYPSGKRCRYAKDGLCITPRAHEKQDATRQGT
jgi:hypothetical protein